MHNHAPFMFMKGFRVNLMFTLVFLVRLLETLLV